MTVKINRSTPAGVPEVAQIHVEAARPEKSGHSAFMIICCAAMVAAFGFALFAAPATQSWAVTAYSALPLVACVGAHLIMHKFMGKSCHGTDASRSKTSDNLK